MYPGKYLGQPVAVKVLYPFQLEADTIDRFCKEVCLLSAIRHPNIVHVEGACIVPPRVCMVMELCMGNLFELLRAELDWSWDLIFRLALDCTRAVACLHGLGMTHKDIKSLNFLVGRLRTPLWTPHDITIWLRTSNLEVFADPFLRARVRGETLLELEIVYSTLSCEVSVATFC